MKKYIKGDIVPPKEGEFAWEARISGGYWINEITVLGRSKKKVKRLRKKIMKALNKVDDKEDKERLAILKNGLAAFFGELR